MKILQVTVNDCTRFSLNPRMKTFTYTPSLMIQVILGTNSSGKSSLLQLLTLWPVSHKDLKVGGYVGITVEHEDVIYVLTVTKEESVSYSFIRAGEELNPTHKVSVQQELVTQIFGVTSAIHSLMVDETKFTQMSPAVRRQWFISASGTDYDYLLSVFKKTKDEHTAQTHIIKHLETRLIRETETAASIDIDQATFDKLSLNAKLSTLLEYKTTVPKSMYDIDLEAATLLDTINLAGVATRRALARYNKHITEHNLSPTTVNNRDHLLTALKKQYAELTIVRDQTMHRVETMHQTEGYHVTQDLPPLDELTIREQDLINTISSYDAVYALYPTIKDPATVLSVFTPNKDVLMYIADNLPTDLLKTYSKEHHVNCTDRKQWLTAHIEALTSTINTLSLKQQNLIHLRDHDSITCPACDHTWYTSFDQDALNSIEEEIRVTSHTLEGHSEELTTLTALLTPLDEYATCYRYYVKLWNNYPGLACIKPLFPLDHVTSFHTTLTQLSCDLPKLIDRLTYVDRLTEVRNQLTIHHQVDKSRDAYIDKQLEELQQAASTTTIAMGKVHDKIKILSELIRLQELAHTAYTTNTNHHLVYKSLMQDRLEAVKQEAINADIKDIRMRLVDVENSITMVKQFLTNMDNLKEEIATHKQSRSDLAILVKELSPVNGLIAEALYAFIGVFLEDMNYYLARIWSYPIKMIFDAPDEEATSLSFRFKMQIGDGQIIDDVNIGSAGIKEVTDLAFKLSMLRRLGFSKFPLMLDEFGSFFDVEHRTRAYNYIKEQLATAGHEQLFIVSHSPDLYSVFSEDTTEYTVVDPVNVDTSTLPSDVNITLT